MNHKIKMTSKGQITIPKEIRDKLMLRFGDHLEAKVSEGNIVLKPVYNADSMLLMEYAGQYGSEKPGLRETRSLTSGLHLKMSEYIRKTRDNEHE